MTINPSKTLVKGTELLRIFVHTPDPLALEELLVKTGWPRATLLRVLDALRDSRLVEASGDGYTLGIGCLALGRAYLDGLDLRQESASALAQLTKSLNETSHLGVLNDLLVVYVEKVEGTRSVRMHSSIGATNPLYCTGVGKAMLAYSGDELLERVLAAGLQRRTDRTLVSERALRDDLEATRRRGFAVDDQENEPDIRCAAAPIFDHDGHVAAGLSVSIPTFRFPDSELARVGRLVLEAAAQISRRLGYREHPVA